MGLDHAQTPIEEVGLLPSAAAAELELYAAPLMGDLPRRC